MNFGTFLGFTFAFAVFGSSVMLAFDDASVIVEPKSALMVVGGSIAATLVCFPLRQVSVLFGVFFRRVLTGRQTEYAKVIAEIVQLAEARRKGGKNFENATKSVSDPFLKDAAEVLFWLKADVTETELRQLLEIRAMTHFRSYISQAKIFKTIAKFPPAFGLMGTTLGLIALLQSLGLGDDAKEMIGPSMAIALVTTLYGLAISNFILIPVSENLTKQTEEDQKSRLMVVEGIMLIQAGRPPKYIEEHVKSFILPSERR